MSLNARQRQQTAWELRTNLAATGLSTKQISDRAGLSEARVSAALAVDDADPLDVWRLRDAIAGALGETGASPNGGASPDSGAAPHSGAVQFSGAVPFSRAVSFSVLSDDKRAAARAWFGYEG